MRIFQRQFCVVMFAASLLGCKRPAATSPEIGKPAPELDGGLTWLNSTPIRLADQRGKVVLVDFFEYSCVNCIRTFPYLQEWQSRYAKDGLVIVGVHTPQYGFSMDPQNVFAGLNRLGVSLPVVVDSDFHIADAYNNRFWPRTFLIDKDGRIRFDHTGEGAYVDTELMIQRLLHEIDPARVFPTPMSPVRDTDKPGAVCYPITTELYLGRTRGQLGNVGSSVSNGAALFSLPPTLEEGRIYASGEWANQSEYLRHTRDTDEPQDLLALRYRATEVNVVMKPEDIYWLRVFVKQDGNWLPKEIAGADIKYDEKGRSYVEARSARMYNLIGKQPYGTYEIQLIVQSRGLSVYSFSFGTCEIPISGDKLGLDRKTS
jgi:thiol-disulfide isomerase/thioredoxin